MMKAKQRLWKNNYPNLILVSFVLIMFWALSVNFLAKYKSNREVADGKCISKDLGISLKLPAKDWTCHNNDGYFYVEPSWVEARPNIGSRPQFTISFDKRENYIVGIESDERFCSPDEYSMTNIKCLISPFYSHGAFKIQRYADQKFAGLGNIRHVGLFDNFLKVEFNSSTNEYKLSKEDISNFDKLFDSIKRL